MDFSPELATSKPELLAMITPNSSLQQNHVILKGPDSQTRPTAVNFQRAFEQSIIKMLNQGKIRQATAIIHTDRPTTPLCNPSGDIQLETLPEEIRNDPQRLKTVRDRTQTVRLLARNQHVRLFVTYTRDGMDKRSEKEKSTFKNELSNRLNKGLKDIELSCPSVPDKMSGATYILELANGEKLLFSLNGSQIQDSSDTMNWEYWLDTLSNPEIKQRLDSVLKFLANCGAQISV